MKRQIMVLFMGLALFSSCYDAMNEVPLERMPPEIAFKDSLKVEMFVNELYVGLNTGIGGYNSFGGGSANQNSFFDCVTDLGYFRQGERILLLIRLHVLHSIQGQEEIQIVAGRRFISIYVKQILYWNIFIIVIICLNLKWRNILVRRSYIKHCCIMRC